AKQRLRELKPLIRSELAKQWIQETGLIPRYLMAAHRAWKGLPPKEQDLTELSLDRIQAWLALLEKQKPGMEEPLYPWIQLVGGRMGAWRTILDNCMLSEDYQLLDSDSPRWLKIPNRDDQPALPFYVELVTKGSNPRIPDRPDRLKVTQAQLDSPYSYFGVARAYLHDVDESPRDELSHLAPLFAGASPSSLEAVAE